MDFREKYLKYKKKYFILRNVSGGVINKPRYFHNTITDQSKLDKDYEIRPTDIFNTTIDINNPYIDTEIKKSKTPKIDVFNKNGQYATMPAKDSVDAYIREGGPHGKNPDYCERSVYYPPPNVRFVSYNVHNFVKQCKSTSTKPDIGKNLDHAVSLIDNLNADILFLQEIVPEFVPWPADSKENETGKFTHLVDKLAKKGYLHYFIGDTHYSTKPDALDVERPYFMLCNATFSKYPIIENYSIALGNNRICIHCLINFPTYYISTYNIHIEFSNVAVDTIRKIPYKFTQINKLAKYIHESSIKIEGTYTDKPVFYILGGDFNNEYDESQKSSEIQHLFDPLTSIMRRLNPLLSLSIEDKKKKMTGQNLEKIIDIFFISGPSDYNYNPDYLIIPNNHSDHYPILYDFMPMKIVR
jgi:endonuclease/exonuclease/phosphatase family metal-dependent hydrolase